MATLKQLKEVYTVIQVPDTPHTYCIYENTEGKLSMHRYIATVKVVNRGYIFNNKVYRTLESLSNAINEYNSTLEYNVEYYNPLLKEEYREFYKLNDYIISLGFTKTGWNSGFGYEFIDYSLKDIYGIDRFTFSISKKFDTFEGDVLVNIRTTSVVTIAFKDLNTAIGGVNTILKTNILYLLPTLIDLGTNNESINIDKLNKITMHNTSILPSSMKSLVKEKLTEVLNTL